MGMRTCAVLALEFSTRRNSPTPSASLVAAPEAPPRDARGVRPHDGLVAVLVEHAPHELSRQKLVLGAVHLIAAHSAVHQVGDQNGAVYAHRVRVPVELGERLQKRVQNL
jgi:hypothetical protein